MSLVVPESLLTRLQAASKSPAIDDLAQALQNAIRYFSLVFNSTNTWQGSYQPAFLAADSVARWAAGFAASLAGPSPITPTAFSTTSGAFGALVSSCQSAIAACNTAGLSYLSELVAEKLKALQTAWGQGQPASDVAAQTDAVNQLESTMAQARAALDALGLGFGMTGAPKLTFAASGNTITRDSGSWLDDGFVPSNSIVVNGTSSNNAIFTVTAVTGLVLTVASGVANEGPVSGATVVVSG